MTQYEHLQTELSNLRTKQIIARAVPAISTTAAFTVYMTDFPIISATSFFMGLATFLGSFFLYHHALKSIFRNYRRWSDRSDHIAAEIVRFRSLIAGVFSKYPTRRKGEQFKKAYGLAGKSLPDLEEALAVGMHREKREVFVTAFMRKGIVVRATASIGSLYRCSAADNPARWKGHVNRLACDEIRQYHNHPVYNGQTQPSSLDFRSSKLLKPLLGPHSTKLCSLIIYWNNIGEWKILEYNDEGQHWINSEFDIATKQQDLTAC